MTITLPLIGLDAALGLRSRYWKLVLPESIAGGVVSQLTC